MKVLNVLLSFILLMVTANADSSHAPVSLNPAGVEKIGSANISTLNLDLSLSDDYGRGYFFLNAKNDEEKFINQGYASLNVFHYVDAYRSFNMAYKRNHKSVLALVGMSFAVLSQDTSISGAQLASAALNKAFDLSQGESITKREEAWLNFSKAYYMMKIGDSSLLKDKGVIDGSLAFQSLSETDGSNIEFKVFVHWILLNNSNFQYIENVLESVVATTPEHAGAHHYLLHISEMVNDIKKAQSHGEQLIGLALGSAHAQHMYGHTLPQTGEWTKALNQFLIADKIHHNWAKSHNVEISEDWHYAHNLDLLAATYLGLGDYQNALSNWSKSMQYDARAIHKMIGLALATNQLNIAQNALTQIESLGPQYSNFVSFLRSEESFLARGLVPSLFPNTPFEQLLKKTYSSTVDENLLSAEYEKYFEAKFSSGGFDGWSNGFVELIRAKNIANKLGLLSVEAELSKLESRAKKGHF